MFKKLFFLVLVCVAAMAFTKADAIQQPAGMYAAAVSDTSWHLVHEDAKTKVYYTETVCNGAAALKLRVVNLSDEALKFSYKLWDDAAVKEVSLFAKQELEGLCADEYKTVLMETVPAGSTIAGIKVTLTYLQ